MTKPYVICHMMMSVDGRIDCAMTSKLEGVNEYYSTLAALDAPTRVSGRVTAEIEMAEPGVFASATATPLGTEGFKKMLDAEAYEVIVDTKGKLLWPNQAGSDKPLLVLTSENVSKEYLAYLEGQQVSWIACGTGSVDLVRASEILASNFGVERMAAVGGGTINGGFLAAGLLSEVSILLAPGIDARRGMAATFDGLPMETEPFQLELKHVEQYGDGAVWLRYNVK